MKLNKEMVNRLKNVDEVVVKVNRVTILRMMEIEELKHDKTTNSIDMNKGKKNCGYILLDFMDTAKIENKTLVIQAKIWD